jgi:imidazolonepropionase-like amidohydrolase
VTTVRDLGDRRFCVVDRRDRQRSAGRQQPAAVTEPAIVAAGPPVTSPAGHCHYMGGEVTGTDEIIAAVAERAERGVDIIKVMASGGVTTPGTEVMATQFSTAELRLLVDQAHTAGLGVTAHAHGTPAVEQAVAAGVDGIEHCSCMDETGFGRVSDETVAALAASGAAVCPTLGLDTELMKNPPLYLQAMLDRLGMTAEQMLLQRSEFAGRLYQSGVRLVSGLDSGIALAKPHGGLAFSVAELVTGGLTVAAALVTATSGAAEACGVGGRKGRLAAGHDADLLAVDGDLEADITALRRPESVVLGGVPVSR